MSEPAAGRAPGRFRRVLLGILLGAVASGALALVTIARSLPGPAAPPPVLGTLPDFHFQDQAGRPFASADLDGKVWVVDFFFTRCTGICPMLTERMHEVDRWARRHTPVAARLSLLSISVDPEHDTPPVLAAYARDHAITGDMRWRLVTGSAPELLDVVVRGFKIAVGERTIDPATGRLDILHGGHLAVVDARRRIRGYFDSDADGIRKLEALLPRLTAEPAPGTSR